MITTHCMNVKTKTSANPNKVVSATAKLVRVIRNADLGELVDAQQELNRFSNSWLVDGNMANLPGLNDCCLSDTDVTDAINRVLEICIANMQ